MNDRFNELKTKGWVNLTAEEKKEYQRLKGDKETVSDDKAASQSQPTEQSKEDGKITLSKEELDRLIENRVKEKTKPVSPKPVAGEWKPVDPATIPKKTCRFRYYQHESSLQRGIIVDLYHHKWDFDEKSREYDKDIYKIVVMFDDNSREEYEIPIERLVQYIETEECEVINEIKRPVVKEHGRVIRPEKKGGYIYSRAQGTDALDRTGGEYAILKEYRDDITFTVKRPSGQTFETKKINL